MSSSKPKRMLARLLGMALLAGAGQALAAWKMNMTEGVTPISHEVYGLHMMVLWLVTLVGIAVFAVMIYSMIKHRKSKGVTPAKFHESTLVEVIWTTVPFLVLVGVAIPATKTLLALENNDDSDLSIKITGYQWKWKYDYLDQNISYFSSLDQASNEARQVGSGKDPNSVPNYLRNVDNPIVVPVNKKIRFLVTSHDVIHSWWVPDLGFKQDAVPGYINEAWALVEKPGTYRGQCAELCGKDHGFMPIVLVAKSQKDFDAWVKTKHAEQAEAAAGATKTWTKDELMAKGEQAYLKTCAACHQPTGLGLPPTFPALKGSKIATGPMAAHLDIVLHGSKKNPTMRAFAGELDDVDLAAIITYERNAWGNNTGDVVQPADIKAAR